MLVDSSPITSPDVSVRSLAGLKKPVGLDLRWKAALRDLQIQLEPRVSRSEAAVQKRLVKMIPGSVRNWIAVKQSNLNQNEYKKNDNETKNTNDNTYEANIPIYIACCNGTRCDDD